MKVYVLIEHVEVYDSSWDRVEDVFTNKKDADRIIEINPHRLFEIIDKELK